MKHENKETQIERQLNLHDSLTSEKRPLMARYWQLKPAF
jgi:hypothetical protein